MAVASKNDVYIKKIISMRDMNNSAYKKKNMIFFFEAVKLIEKNLRVLIGMEFEGVKVTPVTLEILQKVYLRFTNKPLDKSKFHFEVTEVVEQTKKKKSSKGKSSK